MLFDRRSQYPPEEIAKDLCYEAPWEMTPPEAGGNFSTAQQIPFLIHHEPKLFPRDETPEIFERDFVRL